MRLIGLGKLSEKMQDAGCMMNDTGCKMQDTGCRMHDT